MQTESSVMRTLLFVALLSATAAVGCDDDDESSGTTAPGSHTPCKGDPWACPSGETCWVNFEQSDFVCQAAGVGQIGTPCTNSLGQPTCADSLGCYHVVGASQGVCSPFCDPVEPAHRCADGAACRPILYRLWTGDTVFHLCVPEGVGGAGGGQAGAGGGVAGAGGAG